MRIILALALYALAFGLLYAGVELAPSTGWPKTDVELNGCIFLTFGVVLKTIGHFVFLGVANRFRTI